MDDSTTIPSLLDREASGGDTAEGGFSFQDGVLLAHVPQWLAQEGFTSLIREAYADTEARFYVPGLGYTKEFLEVKNHSVAPAEFWAEVDRFQRMDRASPGTYRWFTFASAGLSEKLKPLRNGLRRVRDPYHFYDGDKVLQEQSYRDYERIVLELGHTAEDARFLFEKVLIQDDLSLAAASGEALFRQALVSFLPEYEELSQKTVTAIFASMSTFLKGRLNTPVSRPELERKLRECIPSGQIPPVRPVLVVTAVRDDGPSSALRLDWERYFGGAGRAFPPPDQWNSELVPQLVVTRDWINQNRQKRRVRLEGCRRLSAAFAIGSVFSSVAGYALEMNHRDVLWETDRFAGTDTQEYPLDITQADRTGEHLVVVLDILRDIRESVEADLPGLGLAGMPILRLHGKHPIVSSDQVNLVVAAVKAALSSTVVRCRSRVIHLFFAGPSHLALFLGHRLNATAAVQCYEWTPERTYVPTCWLSP